MTEAPFPAFSNIETVDQLQRGVCDRRNQQLGYPVAMVNYKRLITMIYHYNADFTTIVGINGAGTIYQSDTLMQRETGSGPYLPLETDRDFHSETGRHQKTTTGKNCYRNIERRTEVEPGGMVSHILRNDCIVAQTTNLDDYVTHLNLLPTWSIYSFFFLS
jgi:hypothetical protein